LLQNPSLGQYPNNSPEPSEPTEPPQEELKLWLTAFIAESGHKLSDEQISRILRVIQPWTRSAADHTRLEADALNWAKDPSTFCGTRTRGPIRNDFDLIDFYCDAYEQNEKTPRLYPMRRKVILIKTFELVQKEENDLRRRKKLQQRKKQQKEASSTRTATYRTRAIEAIAKRAWEKLSNEEYMQKREQLVRMVRFGEKWSKIKHKSLTLSLAHTRT
jgi:hypothetical protein